MRQITPFSPKPCKKAALVCSAIKPKNSQATQRCTVCALLATNLDGAIGKDSSNNPNHIGGCWAATDITQPDISRLIVYLT